MTLGGFVRSDDNILRRFWIVGDDHMQRPFVGPAQKQSARIWLVLRILLNHFSTFDDGSYLENADSTLEHALDRVHSKYQLSRLQIRGLFLWDANRLDIRTPKDCQHHDITQHTAQVMTSISNHGRLLCWEDWATTAKNKLHDDGNEGQPGLGSSVCRSSGPSTVPPIRPVSKWLGLRKGR